MEHHTWQNNCDNMDSVKKESISDDDARIHSSRGKLLMLIAGLLTEVLDPRALGLALGISESQVTEIDEGLQESKNKIIRLLERFSELWMSDWETRLIDIVQNTLNNSNLARELQTIVRNGPRNSSGDAKEPKYNIKDKANSGMGTKECRGLDSSHISWEMASGSRGSHSDVDTTSFEQVSEENVFLLRDGEQAIKHENIQGEADHPEMSLHINQVGDALKVVSELLGNLEGIQMLPEVIPQILNLARQMKTQKVLRNIFEEENSNLKEDLQTAKTTITELRETLAQRDSELAELKRTSEDKSLKDFDYVTRKEVHEVKQAEIQHEQAKTQQTSTVPETPQAQPTEGVSIHAYEALQKKNVTLKQKLVHVVKLNHSWDEQYHRMESTLQEELGAAQLLLAERKDDWEKREKERDEILVMAKQRVEKAEAEGMELRANSDQLKQQVEKMNRYASSLQEHKQDLEGEVKRLNEALEQKLHVTEKPPPVGNAAGGKRAAKAGKAEKIGNAAGKAMMEDVLSIHQEPSFLTSLPPGALIEELELLKQQVDVYKSDFYKEQRDRQRAMGELDEVKTELHRTRRKMEKQKSELQILHDQALAFQFHEKELKRRSGAAPRPSRPAYPSSQANVYQALRGPHVVNPYYQQFGRTRQEKELLPHGVNYAFNDEYADGIEEFQVCYPPSTPSTEENGGEMRSAEHYYDE